MEAWNKYCITNTTINEIDIIRIVAECCEVRPALQGLASCFKSPLYAIPAPRRRLRSILKQSRTAGGLREVQGDRRAQCAVGRHHHGGVLRGQHAQRLEALAGRPPGP